MARSYDEFFASVTKCGVREGFLADTIAGSRSRQLSIVRASIPCMNEGHLCYGRSTQG